METTRISLLEQARSSPEDPAWQKIMDIYEPFLEGYLRRRGVSDSDVDDIKQDVLTVLCRELPNFHHNRRPGAFRTWLRNVTANRLRTFWRSPSCRPQVGHPNYEHLADQLSDDASPLAVAWDREHNAHLIEKLLLMVSERFNEQTMQAFRRTFLDNISIDVVARQLDTTPNAVQIARSRVLKVLREVGQQVID